MAQRFSSQKADTIKLKKYAEEIQDTLNIIDKSSKKISVKFDTVKHSQAKLNNKMINLLRKMELLRNQGMPLELHEHK